MLWAFVAVCLVGSALIWILWVLPTARSIERAEPVPLGEAIEVPDGAHGVWVSGRAAMLGLVRCESDGVLSSGPSLDWDDTLWWMTPRDGFEQARRVSGASSITCEAAMEGYEGEYLIAGDTFGDRRVWIGRMGEASGTLLAVGAVGLPLFAAFLTPILIVQAIRRSRARREFTARTA